MDFSTRTPPYCLNIYLNDLFYAVEYTNIYNFANDTTQHCSSTDINEVTTNIEHDCTIFVEWLCDNLMITRLHYLCRMVSWQYDDPKWFEMSFTCHLHWNLMIMLRRYVKYLSKKLQRYRKCPILCHNKTKYTMDPGIYFLMKTNK